jgi:hypothetical protein
LSDNFPLIADESGYMLYDLRNPLN